MDEGRNASYPQTGAIRLREHRTEKGGHEMSGKYIAGIALALFVMVGLLIVNPGTIVNPGDFAIDSFKTALLGDNPGTVVNSKDFAIDSFAAALSSDNPGTVVNPRDFTIDSFKTALLTDDSATVLNTRAIVADPAPDAMMYGKGTSAKAAGSMV
jgi:hypothetical protein